jgi:hypothetical protein
LRENAAFVPCPTTVCNFCRRHGLNKLHRVQKQERRKIIMNRIGESVHIDCRQLSKGITPARPGRTYHLSGRLTVTVARPGWRYLRTKRPLP